MGNIPRTCHSWKKFRLCQLKSNSNRCNSLASSLLFPPISSLKFWCAGRSLKIYVYNHNCEVSFFSRSQTFKPTHPPTYTDTDLLTMWVCDFDGSAKPWQSQKRSPPLSCGAGVCLGHLGRIGHLNDGWFGGRESPIFKVTLCYTYIAIYKRHMDEHTKRPFVKYTSIIKNWSRTLPELEKHTFVRNSCLKDTLNAKSRKHFIFTSKKVNRGERNHTLQYA